MRRTRSRLLLAGLWLACFAAGAYWRLSTDRGAVQAARAPGVQRAVVVLQPVGASGVSGAVAFIQRGGTVTADGVIRGLKPGVHGLHIHQFGDLTDTEKGLSAGEHYNPTNRPHGAPESRRRHVGDLGNITANAQGTATVAKSDTVIRLTGAHSIIGRSLVVHAGADKFTQPSGDSGARVAFGVVGTAEVGR